MEVQYHGLQIEDLLIKGITGFTKSEYQCLLEDKYTSSMDIQKGIKSEKNYSIKVSKNNNTIGCADITNFMLNCKQTEFTIIVVAWTQLNIHTKRFYQGYEFDITPDNYVTLWGNIDYKKIEPFVDYVKNIPSGKIAQLQNKTEWKKRRSEIYESGRGLCSIDAKIDSKNQRRVQCSIKISDLIDPKNNISFRRHDTEYKGIKFPYDINSSPRIFTN